MKPEIPQKRTVRLFLNGRSQCMRIPAEFRFDCDEVTITADKVTGTLTVAPATRIDWAEWYSTPPSPGAEDFLKERNKGMDLTKPERSVF